MDLKKLAEDLDLEEDEYAELIELFVESGNSDLEKLQTAVEEGNTEEAAGAAHSLKGAAGNLGLMDFYEAAKRIEIDAREGNMDRITEDVQMLRKNLAEIEGLV